MHLFWTTYTLINSVQLLLTFIIYMYISVWCTVGALWSQISKIKKIKIPQLTAAALARLSLEDEQGIRAVGCGIL